MVRLLVISTAVLKVPKNDFGFARRDDEAVRINIPVKRVSEEQATEEQHFASEKYPDAE